MHTTTTAKLFHLPNNGKLIDSPGIREVAMWHIDETELAKGFIEFQNYLGLCKFRDCKHDNEPHCAIKDAAENGDIGIERMASFQFIRSTLQAES